MWIKECHQRRRSIRDHHVSTDHEWQVFLRWTRRVELGSSTRVRIFIWWVCTQIYTFITIYSSQLMRHIITQLAISIIEILCFFWFPSHSVLGEICRLEALKSWRSTQLQMEFVSVIWCPLQKPFLRSGSPCLNTMFHISWLVRNSPFCKGFIMIPKK